MPMRPRLHATAGIALLAGVTVAAPRLYAEDAERLDQLRLPESSISLGIGVVSGERHRFGQYNGLARAGSYGLADIDLTRRDGASGTWLSLRGRNLGLDSRELRFEHQRQGDWGYFIDFSQLRRVSQYAVTTGLQGIGSHSLTVSPLGAQEFRPQVERQILTLGAEKYLIGDWDLRLRMRNEVKDGTRLFGRGTASGSVLQFLAEPIQSTTRQLDASLAYTGSQLQLVAAYYGAFYNNHDTWLAVGPTGTCTVASSTIDCFTPLALPPDNRSHQLSVAGGYSLSRTTRATFKLAHTRATQDDSFAGTRFATVNRSDLGGVVATTQLQLGLSAQPLPKLTLTGNLRVDDKNDKTPVVRYFGNPGGVPIGAGATLTGENEPRSLQIINGRVEASYPLPAGLRLSGGVEYDRRKRNTDEVRSVGFRDTVSETIFRGELRRALGETLTGALSYQRSERNGSAFRTNFLTGGGSCSANPTCIGSNLIAPVFIADRTRDKLRMTFDWTPIDALALQLIVDHADDDYSRSRSILGVDSGQSRFQSADVSYQINEEWRAHAWVSREAARLRQATVVGASAAGSIPATGPLWSVLLKTDNQAFGFGIKGKLATGIELGADLQWSDDRFASPIERLAGTAALPASLPPDYYYRKIGFKLFGDYALNRDAGVRAQIMHERLRTDDWTWNQFAYTAVSDGSVVSEKPLQKSSFVGVAAYYRWR